MTQRFILDENVVILAQKGENDKEERDLTCLQLITQIIRICHTIILDSVLRDKYLHQLNLPRYHDPRLGFRLLSVLLSAETVRWTADPTSLRRFPKNEIFRRVARMM